MNTTETTRPTRPTRILLLGAPLDSDNRGIGALALGALSLLMRRYPQREIRCLDYGREPITAHASVDGKPIALPLINLRFSKNPWLANHIVWLLLAALACRLGGHRVRRWLLARNRWLRQIAEADMAVAVSGGDSFADLYGFGRFCYMAWPQWLVLWLGVPLVLLPQTIGPLRSPLARWMARDIVARARATFTREEGGVQSALQALRPRDAAKCAARLRFGYDLGFILQPRAPGAQAVAVVAAVKATGRPLVGLNISGLLSIGGYDGRNRFALKGDYTALMERVIGALIGSHQASVLLVPHVFGDAPESDTRAIDALYSRLQSRYPGRLFRSPQPLDAAQVKYVIGQCDLFIGARMHACIAALSQAVPAVGIAYSAKFAGVLGSVGAAPWVADPRTMGADVILALIGRAFGEREALHAQLAQTMPAVQRSVHDLVGGVLDEMLDEALDGVSQSRPHPAPPAPGATPPLRVSS